MGVRPHQDFKLMKEEKESSPLLSWCPQSGKLPVASQMTARHMNKIILVFHHHHIW